MCFNMWEQLIDSVFPTSNRRTLDMLRYNMDEYLITVRDEHDDVVRRVSVYARSKAAAIAMFHSKRGWASVHAVKAA